MIRKMSLAAVFALALVPQGLALELFWNDVEGIHRLRSGDPTIAHLFQTFETRGIVVDGTKDRLLWSDILPLGGPLPGGVIRSASIHGGEITDVARHLTSPAGIALEPNSGKIYWTDLGDAAESSAVFSANTDGSDMQELISAEWLSEIEGIAIDSQRKHLFFTYVNPLLDGLFNGGIARAGLDGSNVEPIISGLLKPIGIALDSQSETIFWADAQGLGGGLEGVINAADFDGQQRRTLLGGLDKPFGVALDLDARDIYWTDVASGRIQRTEMSGILPFFEDVVSGLDSLTAIAIVPEPGVGTMAMIGTLVVAWAIRRRPAPKRAQRVPAGNQTSLEVSIRRSGGGRGI